MHHVNICRHEEGPPHDKDRRLTIDIEVLFRRLLQES
jgi:hypothetical protein